MEKDVVAVVAHSHSEPPAAGVTPAQVGAPTPSKPQAPSDSTSALENNLSALSLEDTNRCLGEKLQTSAGVRIDGYAIQMSSPRTSGSGPESGQLCTDPAVDPVQAAQL